VVPERTLELVLNVEQPDTEHSCEKRYRQLHEQERHDADKPDEPPI